MNNLPMKPKLFYLLVVMEIAIAYSCTTLKRYNSIKPSGSDNTLAGIDLFGFRLSKAKPEDGRKTLWDLSADAQSQYIKILNSRYPDNDEFIKALNFEYLKEEKTQFPEDYVNKDLRLIFSISKLRNYGKKLFPSGLDLSPADRIEYLKITLRIPEDSGLQFTEWNMFTTEYGSVDIADINFSRSLELETSGLLAIDKKESGGELSAGGKSSVSRREDQAIKYRYLKLNGRINNHEIEMEEEGIREIDLTGNITADVSLEFDRFPGMLTSITGMKDSTGRFNDPDRLMIQQRDVIIPMMENIKDTIYADLKMDYVFRNVLNGRKTFPEWDDRVKYYTGSVLKRIPLFSSRDYVPEFYCIGTDNTSDKRDYIKLSSGNKSYAMIFRTHSDANSFYEWLIYYFMKVEHKGIPIKIGGYTLKLKESDLTNEMLGEYPGLRIIPYYK
jgi:hypothetical protein